MRLCSRPSWTRRLEASRQREKQPILQGCKRARQLTAIEGREENAETVNATIYKHFTNIPQVNSGW